MAELTWKGGKSDWYDPDEWTLSVNGEAAIPVPGDSVTIQSGTSKLIGTEAQDAGEFDDQEVSLGSAAGGKAPRLDFRDAFAGLYFDVAVPAGDGARIAEQGTSGFDGSLDVRGQLDIATGSVDEGRPGDFVFTSDALLTVYRTGSLTIDGDVKLETPSGQSVVRSGGTLAVDGSLSLLGGAITVKKGATLKGSGTVHLGPSSVLDIRGGAAAPLRIAFDDPGATLKIVDVADFHSAIEDFTTGDTIDLTHVIADDAAFDPGMGTLDVRSGGADGTLVAQLSVSSIIAGPLEAVSDGKGGTLIEAAGSRPTVAYNIDTADWAMGSDVVRSTMTTSDRAPINGSGVKIGIVSDSFDATGTADAAAAADYLPSDASTGASAVTVLKDDPDGSDEGQAMAELIHQVAPGAQIYFYAGGDRVASAAKAVTALQQAGCNIITDDIGFPNEPIFQVTDKLDAAIQSAIDDGVSYFTAASNEGNAFYQGPFDPEPTQLMGQPGEVVMANRFSDGTPYQTITATGGERLAIDVQWDAPYPSGGGNVADSLVANLYDAQGDLVATSHQLKLSRQTIPEIEIDLKTPVAEDTEYRLAIYQPDGTPVVGQFYYTLNGTVDGGSQPGGYVDDPTAEHGAGTTYGHDLVPNANTVGTADWSNSPVFGTPSFAEGFSSGGPGELLFDGNGDRLPEPVDDGKVDFLAPDGTATSTPGFEAFLGTSAAAPNAAAVAALMLQANRNLSPSQVTELLKASAVDYDLSSSEQGAGLIQAPAAVAGALRLSASTHSPASVAPAGSRQRTELQPYGIALNHRQGDTTFVFSPGDAFDVVRGFQASGANHDVVSLSGADFGNSIAEVLRNTGDVNGSAFITDPVTGDAIRLAGVTTAELKAHPKDVSFHA